MNWVDFADRNWYTVLGLVILSGISTVVFAWMNIILIPEIPNYPVYFAGIITLIFLGFFLFLWFQPKEIKK